MKQKIKCAICGIEFEKYIRPQELKNNKYGFSCSKHKREHLDRINKIIFRNGYDEVCSMCGKNFYVRQARNNSNKRLGINKPRFCSRKCMFIYKKIHKEFQKSDEGREILSEKMRGSKNPLYKNGNRIAFAEYDYKFRPLLRKQIREKFNNTCCLCGRHKQDNEKNFACHHKDFNKKNNDIENFELLCKSCHKIKHEEHKKILKTPPPISN